MNSRFTMFALVGIVLSVGLFQMTVPPSVRSQDATRSKVVAEAKAAAEKKPGTESSDLDNLNGLTAEFEKAFNSGSAKGIAAQFTETGEIVDEDGEIVQGTAAITERFEELFKEFPKAKIEVEVTSLRRLTPELAVEDGYSATTLDPKTPGARSPYTLVYVKKDGKWLIASVRDFPEEPQENSHTHLQQLDWLIGHWVDESPEGRVETQCQWSEDGNYLIQEYIIKSRKGLLKGTQRIAWDPLRKTIRSWAFDQSGAFTEAKWTPLEDHWILKVEGVAPDGQSISGTRHITPLTPDSFQLETTGVILGHTMLPDTSVRVVRRPPVPGL